MKCRAYWAIAVVMAVAYVVICVHVAAICYGDYPDHLARAVVMADLLFHRGAHFGTVFQFHPMPVPYLLGDLLLVAVVELFGVNAATAIWTAVNLLALPVAMQSYLYVTRSALHTRALFFVVSLYLSTDWFFLASFLNFRLAVAMTIFALALAQSLRRSWSASKFAAYVALVALGYLMHLSFIVFIGVALGATALCRLWTRETTLRREIWLFGPVLCVLAWHMVSARVFPDAAEVVVGHVEWGTLLWKVRRLDWDFVRLRPLVDWLLALGLAGCVIAAAARRATLQSLTKPNVLEMLALTVAFVALYIALPMRRGDVTYIDVRALALATPFAAFSLLMLFDEGRGLHERARDRVYASLVMIALGNLVYLGMTLLPYHAWLKDYGALSASVPAGSNVLPVYTRAREGRWRPFFHATPLSVVIDRGAIIPNMFSGDRGQPMKYFRYIQRPYAPVNDWYGLTPSVEVDWNAIACSYDFILVTAPFEPQRIKIATTVVAQNASGTLLQVDRKQCQSSS